MVVVSEAPAEKIHSAAVACQGLHTKGKREVIALTYSNLEKRGIGRALLEKIHAPIGIEIMAQSPAEIAVSILAEIIKTYREDKKQLAIDYSMLEYLEREEEKLILVRIIEKEGSGPRERQAATFWMWYPSQVTATRTPCS